MPKQRPPSSNQTQHCSFCGEHKNNVPLIVTSSINPKSACCSTCALAIIQQTHVWAYGIFQEALKIQKPAPKIALVRETTDAAIRKATKDGD
jgi:hypothetical protein